MAFGFARNRQSPIGIDAGADQLKLLQLGEGDPPPIVGLGCEPVPEEARNDHTARLQFLEEALQRWLQQGGFRGRRAMCTIPAFQTYVHHFDIAAGQKASRQQQIEAQIRQRLEIEPGRMVVRTFDTATVQYQDGQYHRVVCLAARRDQVMQYVELARRCRLEVVGMHGEPLCVVRAFSHLKQLQDPEQVTCFLDLGAAASKIAIAHGSEMVFTKTIDAGANQAIRDRAHTDAISFDQARAAHLAAQREAVAAPEKGGAATALASPETDGQPANDNPFAQPPDDLTAPPLAGTDDEAQQCLIDDLQLALRYHARLFPEKPVQRLVFVGGEACRTSLCHRIAQAVELPAQMGDPIARLGPASHSAAAGVELGSPQPGWAAAVGLCLSEANL
jgi:Tfp pilus assembly PilM family ATPase